MVTDSTTVPLPLARCRHGAPARCSLDLDRAM
jgi:hypothetical protein